MWLLGMSAPVGQACTHSPQPTQLLPPIGSAKSNTTWVCAPLKARPITSLTCRSRQARWQRLHWMQASKFTAMAGCDRSAGTASRWSAANAGRTCTPRCSAHWLSSPCGASARSSSHLWPCSGKSASSISRTIFWLLTARSLSVRTCMPGVALRQQLGARVRSPSTSTTQARQLPSGAKPSLWHRCGMLMPRSLAMLKMLLPAGASTDWPLRVN